MLTFDDLKEYFEKFFISYAPYRDNKVYSIILDKLINNYFNTSYNEIPSTFKSAFEQQKIPIEFYDNILLSSGFTKEILGKISYKDKEILLKSFTDFNIYKGTLNQIQKVASDFEEELNLYELLIDFRTAMIPYYYLIFLKDQEYVIAENEFIYDSIRINDHIQIPGDSNSYRVVLKKEDLKIYIDKPFDYDVILEYNEFLISNSSEYNENSIKIKNINVNRWVFVPELIYSGDKVKSKVLKTFLDYEKIYNETKKYFVSIEQLEKEKENLLLPIKSNLIFLDYKKFREINLLNYLFAAIILKEYRKSRMVIYFKDGNYLTNLEKIYKLWYYIIFRFYNKGISTSGLPDPALIFSIDSPYFNLKIIDIEKIKIEYESINNANDISLFYNKYFSSSFYPLHNIKTELPIDQFKLIIENEIGTDLLEYVDKRILNAQGVDSEFECSFLLDELYSSVITWSYSDNSTRNNINYLLDSLSYISTSVDFSPTYNLILFLKPFHVELVKESDEILEINNKFNLVNPDFKIKFFIKLFEASLLNISHRILNSKIILTPTDNVILNSGFTNNIFYKYKSILSYIDNFLQLLQYFEESVVFENHLLLFNIKSVIYSIINIVNESVNFILKQNYENVVNIDKSNLLLISDFEGILQSSDLILTKLNLKLFDKLTILHEIRDHHANFEDTFNTVYSLADDQFLLIDLKDFDSSGRNILDIFDINTIYFSTNPISISHSFNLISG